MRAALLEAPNTELKVVDDTTSTSKCPAQAKSGCCRTAGYVIRTFT